MSSVDFRVSDCDTFLFGLLTNVVTMQLWILKPLLLQQDGTLDFADPEVQQWAAEQVVDLVTERFGATPAAADMRATRADLIKMLVDGMPIPTPTSPKLSLVK